MLFNSKKRKVALHQVILSLGVKPQVHQANLVNLVEASAVLVAPVVLVAHLFKANQMMKNDYYIIIFY